MSDKKPKGAPDRISDVPALKNPEQPEEFSRQTQQRALSWLIMGGLLAWKAGKRLMCILLRLPIEESAPVEERMGAKSAPQIRRAREGDRNLTLETERNLFRRKRWGTFLAGLSFAAAFCSGVRFLFIYWTGGGNQALGGCLAGFFGLLAVGLVIHAHLLAVHKEASEPRENVESPPEERAAAAEAFRSGELELQRRGMLKWAAGIGLGTLAVMFVSLLRSVMSNPFQDLYTGVWKPGQRLTTRDGKPVRADDLSPGNTTIVFPQDSIGSEKAQTVLIRVDPRLLELPSDRADWAPLGYLAYSRVCTHAGCPVGMYEKTVHLLMCPCHQSTFAVLRAAQPTGGPAARALPQLPLYVDAEGNLRARGGFTAPPGPGFWGMPT
jgi:ubiquinol-cytochrome c reductase iron-sulfur subunit